ncbi:MAG: lytic transglycosylase domain-containing protein [Spirochaetes bacterium]|nr:lytic transglycosylase domain-containing protein [Spirochaetota bacterium]
MAKSKIQIKSIIFDMKRAWLFLILVELLLIGYGSVSLAKSYYDKQLYQKYKDQYVWLDEKIYQTAKEETESQGVDLKTMLAIFHSESRGNRYAISSAGAIGLGQVMPVHYKGRKEVLFDPEMNIHLAVRVFKICMDKHNGNLIKALNCYEGRNNREDVNVKYLSEIIENIYYNSKD